MSLVLVSTNTMKNTFAANPYASFYDLYYILEDFDGDGNDDGATVEFDVDIDSAISVEVTVTANLYSATDQLIDTANIRYITYYDDIDYRTLVIGPVAADGWYYIEIILEQGFYPAEYYYSEDEYLYDAHKEWTVMVYMDGDNNLEPAALKDFNEMELAGGTTSEVNVVTIFDRCSTDYETPYGYANDWSGTRYYEVRADSDIDTMNSYMVQDLGEQNMGEIATLYFFIEWAMTYYAADHYALVFWDHGGGFDGACWDEDNGNDNLDMFEIWYALQEYYLDFIGFDACNMGQFEVLYQLRNYCDILGVSMIEEPGDGWDYYSSLSSLISNPYMTAAQLGQTICEDYIASYPDDEVIFGVYDLTELSNLEDLVNNLSQELSSALPSYKTEIYQARLDTRILGYMDSCDFYQFLVNLGSISYSPLVTATSNFLTALDNALIYTDSTCFNDFYGLAIYLPAVEYPAEFQNYLDNVYSLNIVSGTYWKTFLTDWRTELSNMIPEWDETNTFSGTISAGEATMVRAYLPATPKDDAYIVTLEIESDMQVSLMAWDEERSFTSSSFMPLNIPETVGFFCDSATTAFFFITCDKGSGVYNLDFFWIDVEDDSNEDNDVFAQATLLDIDSTYFMMGMDEDYFKIDVEAGDTITAAIEFNSLNDYDLYIYDQTFTEVAYSAGYTNPEIVEFIADYTGIYYLYVNPFDTSYVPYYTISTRVIPDEAPQISDIIHSPENPEVDETITVTCSVEDNIATALVELWYNTTSGWTSIVMSHIGEGIYQATIPYQAGAVSVQYYISAEDAYDHVSSTDYYTVTYTKPASTETPTPTDETGFYNLILPVLILLTTPIIIRRKK